MQGFPTDVERSGERLVYWTSPEVSRHFQGAGTPVLNTVPRDKKKEEERHLSIDHASRKEESLKDFMLRFNKEKLEVDTPDEKTMLCALMQGVRAEGPLMAEVGRKNGRKVTLPQFMKLTEEFIHQEELVGTLLKAQTLEEQAKQESKKASTAPKLKEEKNPRKGKRSRAHYSKVSLGRQSH
jgi:hypothetical protein